MTSSRARVLLGSTFVLAACSGDHQPIPTEGESAPPISPLIVDGGSEPSHSGFYFLPPLVPEPDFNGQFDSERDPSVEICALDDKGCVETLVTYTTDGTLPERIRVDEEDEHYILNWPTRAYDLDPETFYRIQVLLEGLVVGFVDVDVLARGERSPAVDGGEYATVTAGRTVPVKFRIETDFSVPDDGGDGGTGATTALTCSTPVSGSLHETDDSELGDYSCGDPSAPLAQEGAEDVYGFTCQVDGDVALVLSDASCDLDLYVLDETGDPGSGCIDGSTGIGSTEGLVFSCVAGNSYFVTVEGYGYTTDSCSGTESYDLAVDVDASSACQEDCDDGIDNDFDGAVDCEDSVCSGAAVCGEDGGDPVEEVCDDGVDNDDDGAVDCEDSACSEDPVCDAGGGDPVEEVCDDGVDNDDDGAVDCDDSSCSEDPACDASSGPLASDLTCSSEGSSAVDLTAESSLGGTSSSEQYACGDPFAPTDQTGPEDVYSFACQVDGDVTVHFSDLTCDLDFFALDSSMDPSTGCLAGSTEGDAHNDALTFSCLGGETYYLVVEAVGATFEATAPGYCDGGSAPYSLDFETSAGAACEEDCDDGIDNDFDGATDCEDSACGSDPLCAS